MVTEPGAMVASSSRRRWLAQVAALGLAAAARPVLAQADGSEPLRFAAAWESEAGGYQVGVLQQQKPAGPLARACALSVPTRAHGVWAEPGGTLLAVARRPGDWLLRLRMSDGKALAWSWMDGGRAFNGHVIASADGKQLYTTETDLETAEGLIGVRDAASLEKVGEWRTHGADPHELLLDADGSLLVANGGIPTLPETGRLKVELHRMDASLVRLDTRSGQLLGQWRLADSRLSLRHIAWGADAQGARVLGIALQAEHEDAAARRAAPLLARFDGRQLTAHGAAHTLNGYGGDIAFAGGRFAVSCPRADGVALWRADGQWEGFAPLAEACPLAADRKGALLWAGGRDAAARLPLPGDHPAIGGLRVDNHWLMLG
ncbi:DUF1513 domain-containing protein [Xenophilus arseniciresistens]|uniref:DUF1513 domain-containing protein n=2 Tax=Xenophilus arseniciresistens TaxID=1283306 RepID=A0AAE3T0Q6_9BURK|nr:DUF1513 domain-containing protein [Xenophilus arseniciresistens]MDA7416557.1 DUF1513 domain-containing protein [Xenophilus arseniciresistens]